MLEHVPAWLGGLLKNVRAGHEKLVIVQPGITGPTAPIDLSSPAFANWERLPERFTADGLGSSPPLVWGPLPPATASVALIVEDPDAPAFQPLVHAIVWHIPPDEHTLPEAAIAADRKGDVSEIGRNSFMSQGWLPPDPPTGHGSHDYVFQLFALAEIPPLDSTPGRTAFVEAIAGKVLAAGMLVGTYSRSEPAKPLDVGSMGVAAPA